jgi:enoyl-CoA hydratase/carnithine racemase
MGRAMEIILGAHDFDADLAERYGSINRALNPDEIEPFVEELANRIAKFPAGSITACKRCVIKVYNFFCVGVVYSAEYYVCDVTLSVYPHRI